MRTIYKYDLMLGYNSLYLPDGYKVVHVAEQYGSLVMWVEQSAIQHSAVSRTFNVYGTGYQIPDDRAVHVGTALMSSGLVWHVYETK
jgi:hypothetical protein